VGEHAQQTGFSGAGAGANIGARSVREAATKAAREADRAEVYTWPVQNGRLWRARAAVANHWAMPQWRTRLALRSSAIVVRPAPASRSMPSADRVIPQSGNWKPH
jgi:hypothetical protein